MKYKLLITAAVLAISGCNLDENPIDFKDPDQFYKTDSELQYGINGVYASLRNNAYFKQLFPLACDGYIDMLQTSNTLFVPFLNTSSSAGFSQHSTLTSIWKSLYYTINQANILVEKAEQAPSGVTESLRTRITAEAKFIRALTYFNLVRAWDEIPLRLTPSYDFAHPEAQLASIPDLYKAIIDDLEYCEDHLWNRGETRDGITNDIGRATAIAAKMLLGKVYLHMASSARSSDGVRNRAYKDHFDPKTYYQQCLNKLQEVVESKDFGWEEQWKDIWTPQNNNTSKEMIFSIQYAPIAGQGSNYFLMFIPKNCTYNATGTYGAYGLPPQFVKYYSQHPNYRFSPESTDKRITEGLLLKYVDKTALDANGEMLSVSYVRNGDTFRYQYDTGGSKLPATNTVLRIAKWLDPDVNTAEMSGLDWPVLRAAEVYLMLAEAKAELSGNPTDGFEDYNRVRGRCSDDLLDEEELSNYEGTDDMARFREAIIRERIFEFYMEGYRFFDTKRLGIMQTAAERLIAGGAPAASKKKDQPYHYYWPISQDEIEANSAIGSQKDGY